MATTEQNRSLVRRAWKAFATHDPELISAFFHPAAEWLAPPGNATAVALGGSHHLIGREAIVHFLTHDFPRLFTSQVTVDFRGLYADGDTVVVEETMTAVLSDGGRYENDYCFVFRLRDERIVLVREYMDTARGARMILG